MSILSNKLGYSYKPYGKRTWAQCNEKSTATNPLVLLVRDYVTHGPTLGYTFN